MGAFRPRALPCWVLPVGLEKSGLPVLGLGAPGLLQRLSASSISAGDALGIIPPEEFLENGIPIRFKRSSVSSECWDPAGLALLVLGGEGGIGAEGEVPVGGNGKELETGGPPGTGVGVGREKGTGPPGYAVGFGGGGTTPVEGGYMR